MMDTTYDAGVPDDLETSDVDEELLETVEETVTALLKAVRARQTYVLDNPLVGRFHEELADRLRTLWESVPHLGLTVDEGRLLWQEREVYARPIGPDNLAFRFFKDGVRLIALLPGVEDEELTDFLDVLTATRAAHDEDLLANLWHRDFKTIQLEYVDVSEDESLDVPTPNRGAGAGETIEDMSEIAAVLDSGPVVEEEMGQFADIALGEPDLQYLRREMDAEWARPVVHDVTLALLDQFEMRDQERRRQVVDILREFVPRLLSENDFASVALIVNELQLLANKTGEAETQALVTSLLRDMSEAMAEMLSSSEADAAAGEEDVAALIGALQAEAIPTLVRAVPAVSDASIRQQLSEALDRLVSGNPGYVVDLLAAEDPLLAAEAARIIGRLRITEAEPYLVELTRRPEDVTRQAGIEALAQLGSEAGADAMAEALSDDVKDIRLAALHAIIAVRPTGVSSLLGAWISRPNMSDRDEGEQMAFFKAYAAVAQDEGVPLLGRLLNGRRWWGARRPASVRANAARALGIVGTETAKTELERAASDRKASVKSAVRVAIQALDADSDQRMRVADEAIVDDAEGAGK